MPIKQRKDSIEYAVLVISGNDKSVIPKNSKAEAEESANTYNSETPLFGEAVTATVIARTKTVTVEYGNWGKVKPRI